uniref:Uncharacterized protein n=1 Tax=Tanacetum cinerariifolium TaxID=118510 RepID=A0A6L2KC87_TANCI|nr:hypothetical protein [Tanacetum cinerariifolium]
MTIANQGMSVEEIEQIVTQRLANAIEAIAIYETKTSMDRESMSQTKRRGDKVVENASNKRKWEEKCGQCKRVGYQAGDCRISVLKAKLRPSVAKQKDEVTCYQCRNMDLELQKVILEQAHVVFSEIRNKDNEGANSVENIIASFSFNGFHIFYLKGLFIVGKRFMRGICSTFCLGLLIWERKCRSIGGCQRRTDGKNGFVYNYEDDKEGLWLMAWKVQDRFSLLLATIMGHIRDGIYHKVREVKSFAASVLDELETIHANMIIPSNKTNFDSKLAGFPPSTPQGEVYSRVRRIMDYKHKIGSMSIIAHGDHGALEASVVKWKEWSGRA